MNARAPYCINCGSTVAADQVDPCDCDHEFRNGTCEICEWECRHPSIKNTVCNECAEVVS